jgi:NADPH-dependent ferric siderophore reductase
VVVRVPAGGDEARRVYSIWSWSPQHGLISLRVALHGTEAPGCAWALTAAPGDVVSIEPPRTKISIEPTAAFHLFAGDETGAVPLLAMHAALHRTGPGRAPLTLGVFESADAGTEVPSAVGIPALPWVHRGQASAVASPVLLQAVRRLDLPAGVGVAYLAGESRTSLLLQRYLIEVRGWPRRSVKVQAHWAPGRPGFGAGIP